MNKLPKQFRFLRRRKAELKRELARIEALEANLIETRSLLERAIKYQGIFTKDEFETSPGGQYMKLFLEEKLEWAAAEAAKR